MSKTREKADSQALISQINDRFEVRISIQTMQQGMVWAQELGVVPEIRNTIKLDALQFQSIMDRIITSRTVLNQENGFSQIHDDLHLGIHFMQHVVPRLLNPTFLNSEVNRLRLREFAGAFIALFSSVNAKISALSEDTQNTSDQKIHSYLERMTELQTILVDIWYRLNMADQLPEVLDKIAEKNKNLEKIAASCLESLTGFAALQAQILDHGQRRFKGITALLGKRMDAIEKAEKKSIDDAGDVLKAALTQWLKDGAPMPDFEGQKSSAPIFSASPQSSREPCVLDVTQQIERLKEALPVIKNLKNEQVLEHIKSNALMIPPLVIQGEFKNKLQKIEEVRIEALGNLWKENPAFEDDTRMAKSALDGARILLGTASAGQESGMSGKIKEFVDKTDISRELLTIGKELVTTGIKPGEFMDLVQGKVKGAVQTGLNDILSGIRLDQQVGIPGIDGVLKGIFSESISKGSLSIEPYSIMGAIGGKIANEIGGSEFGGMMSQAVTGAISGAMVGGPVGALLGAGVSLLGGLFGGGGSEDSQAAAIGQQMQAVSETVVRMGEHLDQRIGQLGKMTMTGFNHLDQRIGQLGKMTMTGFNHLDQRLVHLGQMTASGFQYIDKRISERADRTDALIVEFSSHVDKQFHYSRELMAAHFGQMGEEFIRTRELTIAGITGLSNQLQDTAERIAFVGDLVVDTASKVANHLTKVIQEKIDVVRLEQVMLAQGLSHQLTHMGVQMNQGFMQLAEQNQWLGYNLKGGLARIEDILHNTLYRTMMEQFAAAAKKENIHYQNLAEDLKQVLNSISGLHRLVTDFGKDTALANFYEVCDGMKHEGSFDNLRKLKQAGTITAKNPGLSGTAKNPSGACLQQSSHELADKLQASDSYANINRLLAYINSFLVGSPCNRPLPHLDIWAQASMAYVAASHFYLEDLLLPENSKHHVALKNSQNELIATGETFQEWLRVLRSNMAHWQVLLAPYSQVLSQLQIWIEQNNLLKPLTIQSRPAWSGSPAAVQSLDGRLFIAGKATGVSLADRYTLHVYDVETGAHLKHEKSGSEILNLFVLSSGKIVAGTKSGLMLYDPASYSWSGMICVNNPLIPSNCAHSGQIYKELPNGSLIYSTYTKADNNPREKQYIKIIDKTLQKEVMSIQLAYPVVKPVGMLSEKELLVSCGGTWLGNAFPTTLFAIDVSTGTRRVLHTFQNSVPPPEMMTLSPNADMIIYAEPVKNGIASYAIRQCTIKKFQPIAFTHSLIEPPVVDIKMQGSRIFVGTLHKIHILDSITKKEVHLIDENTGTDYSILPLNDGRLYCSNGWIYALPEAKFTLPKLAADHVAVLRLKDPTESIRRYFDKHPLLATRYSEYFLNDLETLTELKDLVRETDSQAIILNKLIILVFQKEYSSSPALIQLVNQMMLTRQTLKNVACSMIDQKSHSACTGTTSLPDKQFFYTRIRDVQDQLVAFGTVLTQMIRQTRLTPEISGHDLLDNMVFSLKKLQYMMFPASLNSEKKVPQIENTCSVGQSCEPNTKRVSMLGPNAILAPGLITPEFLYSRHMLDSTGLGDLPVAKSCGLSLNDMLSSAGNWLHQQWNEYYFSLTPSTGLLPEPTLPWVEESTQISTPESPCYYSAGGTNIMGNYGLDSAGQWYRLDQAGSGSRSPGAVLNVCENPKPWIAPEWSPGLERSLRSGRMGMIYGGMTKELCKNKLHDFGCDGVVPLRMKIIPLNI